MLLERTGGAAVRQLASVDPGRHAAGAQDRDADLPVTAPVDVVVHAHAERGIHMGFQAAIESTADSLRRRSRKLGQRHCLAPRRHLLCERARSVDDE